ncbi:hypothetical protein [Ferrimonas sp.]|uniref:hypothetical protein n=1 Tax=Ferrimonas sp. TaxID=2080861 RepID=UPI003A8FCA72
MKTLIKTIALAIALSSFAYAGEEHQHGGMKDKCAMMGMMGHEQMMAMHQHMQEMSALMDQIGQEQDHQKWQALMQSHMEKMQQGMQMMGCGAGDKMQHGKDKSMPMTMEERVGMMEKHMKMMQMMMGQMVDHSAQEKKQYHHQESQ